MGTVAISIVNVDDVRWRCHGPAVVHRGVTTVEALLAALTSHYRYGRRGAECLPSRYGRAELPLIRGRVRVPSALPSPTAEAYAVSNTVPDGIATPSRVCTPVEEGVAKASATIDGAERTRAPARPSISG